MTEQVRTTIQNLSWCKNWGEDSKWRVLANRLNLVILRVA